LPGGYMPWQPMQFALYSVLPVAALPTGVGVGVGAGVAVGVGVGVGAGVGDGTTPTGGGAGALSPPPPQPVTASNAVMVSALTNSVLWAELRFILGSTPSISQLVMVWPDTRRDRAPRSDRLSLADNACLIL
jgi:hypothetical protein